MLHRHYSQEIDIYRSNITIWLCTDGILRARKRRVGELWRDLMKAEELFKQKKWLFYSRGD